MKHQRRTTVHDILSKKKRRQRITMLTAYDYPFGSLVDKAGIDIVLVGDSLANVVLGLEFTREIGMTEMIHHAKAVNRAVKRALLIGDMPYGSYQSNEELAVRNARRFVTEAGCQAVKLEWFDACLNAARAIVQAGIPVMGHVGLTPQAVDRPDGFKVQGTDAESAKRIIQQAKDLEKVGCFSIVLECVPDRVAKIITESLNIPTIGIGAGVHCDGQVLVTYDLLGLFDRYQPKFVKQYADLSRVILKSLIRYRRDVLKKKFPGRAHSFTMKRKEARKLT